MNDDPGKHSLSMENFKIRKVDAISTLVNQKQGTGGVEDISKYLNTRIHLHNNLSISHIYKNLNNIFSLLDQKKLDSFYAFLDDEIRFRFGSQREVRGISQVKEYISNFILNVEKMKHSIDRKVNVKDTIFVIGHTTYHMKNKNHKTVPFCNVWKIALNGKIKKYHIYCDPTGLFSLF